MHREPEIEQKIKKLVYTSCNTSVSTIEKLPGAGSSRQYYRIYTHDSKTYLACNGTLIDENKSFIYFSKHFESKGLHVPKLYSVANDNSLYIVEDCGSIDLLTEKQKLTSIEIITLYKKTLKELIRFQIQGHLGLDYNRCFVRNTFDEIAMKWDLSYFKYYYLKLTDIEFNEQKLEVDFNTLISFLLQAKNTFFMYRDFQARNILVQNNNLYFIDYQGGMQGPLQYDVVSLLYQAKAELPQEMRNTLLNYYIEEVSKEISIDSKEFINLFQGFVFIRILQTLGAYGYRGIIQQKAHFIASIPQAVANVKEHISIISKIIYIPYLQNLIENLPIITPKQ
jgi:aminoglycoside/choline kinase family phosphotransferase